MTHFNAKALIIGSELSSLNMMEAFLKERGYDVTLSKNFKLLSFIDEQNIKFICISIDFDDKEFVASAQNAYSTFLSLNIPILFISTSINSCRVAKLLAEDKQVKEIMSSLPSLSLLELPDIALLNQPCLYGSLRFLKLCNLLDDRDYGKGNCSEVEYGCSMISRKNINFCSTENSQNLDFELACFLNAESLKSIDPLPYFLQVLLGISSLGRYSNQLFMILSELFSNALEHGVLDLKSDLKNTPEGFSEYFIERSERLDKISSGYVEVIINVQHGAQGGTVTLTVEDSGKGYQENLISQKVNEENIPYNRGLYLVKQLCKEMKVSPKGNKTEVIFQWSE